MPLKKLKKEQEVKTVTTGKMTIDPSMRDYSKDEFVMKKVEKAKEVLTKYGLPEDWVTRK
ncbi:hypothetical protein [Chitinophaga barathri]|uniref:Uncharacterized protein n=1 Tax=Chitinophaga barathri TaxID=1647451 RepID=A0A3N4MFL2_9BACT|nr:hypothetical protein [Chitinophaga barathri]RPD42812.1 hypothetical protein EG028_00500 [Chitinophaga barathri]